MSTHKHKGVLTSKGALRSHPVTRNHTDKNVQKWHNMEVSGKVSKPKNIKVKKQVKKQSSSKVPTEVKSKIQNLFGKTTPVKAAIKKVTGKNRDKEIVINLVSSIQVPIDDEGYIVLDFDNMKQNGVRILKQERTRKNGDTWERTAGMQIPKDIKLYK